MAEASYERQHLALQAAGYINGAGTTAVTFGCQLTRIATGHYGLVLDANNGIVNDESYTFVQPKGTNPRNAVVNDDSNILKSIRVYTTGSPTVLSDTDIEIQLYKTVTR